MARCCDDPKGSPLETMPAGLSALLHQQRGFDEVRRELGIGDDEFIVGTIARLAELKGHDDLLALGSRIRTRLTLQPASAEDLRATLKHLISAAGNPALMTGELMSTLCEHALGNYRVLASYCSELLSAAAQRELPQIDEKLYFDVFKPPKAMAPRRQATTAAPLGGSRR